MSEHIMQTFYAVCSVLAFSVLVVTLVADNQKFFARLQFKPFTCVYCMTWWVAIVVGFIVFPEQLYMIPMLQILAYIAYQRLL